MSKLLLCLAAFTCTAWAADIDGLMFACKVKSFDKDHVVCEANGVDYQVPRSAVQAKTVVEGAAVMVKTDRAGIAAVMKSAKAAHK